MGLLLPSRGEVAPHTFCRVDKNLSTSMVSQGRGLSQGRGFNPGHIEGRGSSRDGEYLGGWSYLGVGLISGAGLMVML